MRTLALLLLLYFFKPPCAGAQLAVAPSSKAYTAVGANKSPAFNDSVALNNKRVYVVAGLHATAYAATLTVLSTAWYSGYAKTPFHTFNDSREWLQMDKVGHAWTAYNIATYSTRLWQWPGMAPRNAGVLGGLSALGYQTILEFLDAHSAAWGWSWADMGANTFGATLFTAQELAWGSQKVRLKFSSFPTHYEPSLQPRADALFGKTFPERLLKDYNAQTYWASVNLHSFSNTFPAWLNLAIGYGANGMYGGFKNIAVDKNGAVVFDRNDIARERQWFLSLDVDWTKIKTNKKGVRMLFSLMNMIKVPAPALELRSGKLKAHWLSF